MDVSIIFVNYKTKDLTINAVKSVIQKTENVEYEIFVVDNNSDDGSIEAIEKEFPQINIIKNPVNAGFGSANNLAIKQAKGKYIFCLNTDTFLINNAIKIMYDYMEKEENSNVGVCGGYLVDNDDKPCIAGGHLPSLADVFWKSGLMYLFPQIYRKKYRVGLNSDELSKVKNIGYITGADIFFRKTVLDEVGLFDENIFMYFEETDLCKRIKDAGFDIKIVDNAIIKHFEGKSNNNELRLKKMIKKSEFYYFHKHKKNYLWLVKIIYIILYFIDWLIYDNKLSKEVVFAIVKNAL